MQEIVQMADDECAALWNNLKLGYTEVPGHPKLREEIRKQIYPTLRTEHILCFAGAEDAIFCSLFALCEQNDEVIVLTPCYQSVLEVPLLKKAKIKQIALKKENDWKIDLEAIEKAIQPNTKCISINFPQNPTGQVITQDELVALAALCKKYNIWLLSDEVYRLLGQPKENWAQSAAEMYDKAISVGVMSKAFGMAGLRIGWIACQNQELLKKAEQVKHYTSICSSGPAEIITLIALRNIKKILARNNAIVGANLAILEDFFKKYDQLFTWIRPQGGCVGFVEYKGKESIEVLAEKLVQEKSVLLMPSSIFEFEGNYFRIGFGRKNMPEALAKFEEFINENL